MSKVLADPAAVLQHLLQRCGPFCEARVVGEVPEDARGQVGDILAQTPEARAVAAAFTGTPPPPRLANLANDGKLGEALLRALALFDAGSSGDLRSVTDALSLLRMVGLEDVARRAALQLMILDRAA